MLIYAHVCVCASVKMDVQNIDGLLLALTWLTDFCQQSVRYPIRVVGGVPVDDVNKETLVPNAQLLRCTMHSDHLLRGCL